MTIEAPLYFEMVQDISNSIQSQMFGKSCFKIDEKAFICFFQNELVVKLKNEIHAEVWRYFDP